MNSYVVWVASESTNCSAYVVFRAPTDADAQRFVSDEVRRQDAVSSDAAGEEISDHDVYDFIRLSGAAREGGRFEGNTASDWEIEEEGASRLQWAREVGAYAAETVREDSWANG